MEVKSDRVYVVYYKRGRIKIMVRTHAIDTIGEREAVAEKAWMTLLGQNELGEYVAHPPTRKIIHDETMSLYESQRADVYRKFRDTVKFTWTGVTYDGTV